MKRRLFRPALALSACLLLSACAGPGTAPSGTGAPSAAPAPSAAETADSLQYLTPQREGGMYASGTGPGTGSDELLLWVDYAQGAVTCLCAQPNCDHQTDACTARVPLPEGSQYTPVILCRAAPDGRLILYVSAQAGSIWVANADGTDRRALVDWTADSIYPWLADGEALYYTGFQASGAEVSPTILYRVPLDGGQPEEVLRLRSTGDGIEQEEIIGAWGRNAVTLYADLRDVMTVAKPDLPPDVTPEEHAAAWAAYDAEMAGHKVTRQVCLRNVDTGETTVLAQWETAGLGAGWLTGWQDGRLYQLSDDLSAARVTTPDGQVTETAVQWPEELAGLSHGSGLSGIVGGQMLVNCYPADAPGGHRVAVDPATGACTEIRLMRLEPATGAEQPMNLYGAGGGYVLLACEQRQTTRTEMGLDGALYDAQVYEERYGLLTVEDFLASRQNWTELNGGYQLSVFAAVG